MTPQTTQRPPALANTSTTPEVQPGYLEQHDAPDFLDFTTTDTTETKKFLTNKKETISEVNEEDLSTSFGNEVEKLKDLEWARKKPEETKTELNLLGIGTIVSLYDVFEAIKESGKTYSFSTLTPEQLLGIPEIQNFPNQVATLQIISEIMRGNYPEGSAGTLIKNSWDAYKNAMHTLFQEMHPQLTQTNQQLSQVTNHINSANIGTAMGGYLGSRGKKEGRIGRTIIGMAIGRMIGNTLEGMDIANINSFGEGVSQLGSNVLRGGMETATDITGGVGDLWSFYKDPSKTSGEKWGTAAGYAALGGLIFMAVKGLGGGLKGLFSSEKKKEKTGKNSSLWKWGALALGSLGLGRLLLGDNWEEKLKGWLPALEGVSDTIGAVLNPAELAKQYLDGQRNKLSEHLATDYPELSKFIQTTHVDVEEANKKLSAMGIEFTEEKYGTKEKAGLALLGSAFLLTAIRHKGVLIAGVGIAGLMAIASYFGLGKEITDPLMGLLESGVEILNDGDKWWQGENNTGGKREYFAKILEKYGQKEVANTVRSLSWENLTEGISYTTGTGFGMMALLAFRKGKFFTGASRAIIGSWIIGREMLDKGDIKNQEWKEFQTEATAELKELSMGQIIKIYNKHGVQFSAEVFPEEMQAMFTDESFGGVVDDLLKQDFEPEIWEELFTGGVFLMTLLGAKMLLGGIFSLGKKGGKWKMLAITLLTGYGIGELSEWDPYILGNFANGTNEVYVDLFAERIPQMNRNVIEKFLPEWKWVQKVKAEYLGINNYDYILESQKEITDLKTTLSSLKSEHSEHKNFVTQIQRIENLIASEQRGSQNPNFLQLPSMEFNILASIAERAGITSHHSGMLETGFTLHIGGEEIKNLPNPPTEKTTSEELDTKRESFIIAGLHQLHKDLFSHLPESKGHDPAKVKAAQTEVKRIQAHVENIGPLGFGEKEVQSIIDSLKKVGVTVEMEKPKDGKVSPGIPQGELIAHFPDGYRMTWGVSPKMDEKTFQEQEKRMGESLLESFIDGHKESYREAIVGASNAMLAVLDIAGVKGEKAKEFRHLLMEMKTNKEFFDSPLAVTKLFTRIKDFSFLNIGVSLAENGVIIFSVTGAIFTSVVKDVVWDTGAELVSQVWKGDLSAHELAYASGLIPTLTFGAGASALYRYGGFTVDPETKKLVPRKGAGRMALRRLSYIPKKAFWELPMTPAKWTKQAIDWRRFNELYNEKTAMNKADAKGNTMRRIKRLALFTDMRREAKAELMVQKYLKLERQKVYIQNKKGTGVRLLRGSEMQKIILKQADLEKQFAKIVDKLPDTEKWNKFKHEKTSLAYHAENDDGVKKLREMKQGKSTSTPKTGTPQPEKPESQKPDSPKAEGKPNTANRETTSENKAPKPVTPEKPEQNIDPEAKSAPQQKPVKSLQELEQELSQKEKELQKLQEIQKKSPSPKINGKIHKKNIEIENLKKDIEPARIARNKYAGGTYSTEKLQSELTSGNLNPYEKKAIQEELSRRAKGKITPKQQAEVKVKTDAFANRMGFSETQSQQVYKYGIKIAQGAGIAFLAYTLYEIANSPDPYVVLAQNTAIAGVLGGTAWGVTKTTKSPVAGVVSAAMVGLFTAVYGKEEMSSVMKWIKTNVEAGEDFIDKHIGGEWTYAGQEFIKEIASVKPITDTFDKFSDQLENITGLGKGENAQEYFTDITFDKNYSNLKASGKDLPIMTRGHNNIEDWNQHVEEEIKSTKENIKTAESRIRYYSGMTDKYDDPEWSSSDIGIHLTSWENKLLKQERKLQNLKKQTINNEWITYQINDIDSLGGMLALWDIEITTVQNGSRFFYRKMEELVIKLRMITNLGYISTLQQQLGTEKITLLIQFLKEANTGKTPRQIRDHMHLLFDSPFKKIFSQADAKPEQSSGNTVE